MSVLSTFDYAALATEHATACNLCGGESFTPVCHKDRAGFPATTVLCDKCGLLFLNPRMSADAYAEFYASGTYRKIVTELHHRTDAETHDNLIASQQFYADAIVTILDEPLAKYRGGTLLDVGGSTGVVAQHICERYGLTGTVLDPADSEVSEARERGLACATGTVESWDSPDLFDVIGIFQSVDHFLDIAGALRKVRRWLKSGGTLVVDIVEVRTLLNRWAMDKVFKIDHAFGLTDSTMRAFLARAGFRPKRRGVSSDSRKVFYICEVCEPADVLPGPESIEEIRMLCGVRG